MDKISGQKFAIRFFSKYLAAGRTSNKIFITQEQRREGINRFQFFHTTLRSVYGQKMGHKRLEHLGIFPRKTED